MPIFEASSSCLTLIQGNPAQDVVTAHIASASQDTLICLSTPFLDWEYLRDSIPAEAGLVDVPHGELSWLAELLSSGGVSWPVVLKEATLMGNWPPFMTVSTIESGTLLSVCFLLQVPLGECWSLGLGA